MAPFFLEPPKSQAAVLGASVLVNCRAGGQPSPQIRWRRLQARLAPSSAGEQGDVAAHQVAPLSQTPATLAPSNSVLNGAQTGPTRHEFRVITSNSHIQVLENGSMLIREVELTDASQYVCQAFNGISPALSESIELQVLSEYPVQSKTSPGLPQVWLPFARPTLAVH